MSGNVILYENEGYGGKQKSLDGDCTELRNLEEFSDGARSVILKENAKKWLVFTKVNFHGAEVALEPDRRYTSLDSMGLGNPIKSMRIFPAPKEMMNEGSEDLTKNFSTGVRSAMVDEQSEKWQVFAEVNYQGAKVLLEPGRNYTSLDSMGLGSAVKSLKKFDSNKRDEHEK
ncbi:uncharacterized protein [Montipora foliosa]|uniref:uncharacterized protein isoform X2 n=1 Tax=Montipora foliosa TaxID=591990 RepID=UPI0035F0FCE6